MTGSTLCESDSATMIIIASCADRTDSAGRAASSECISWSNAMHMMYALLMSRVTLMSSANDAFMSHFHAYLS